MYRRYTYSIECLEKVKKILGEDIPVPFCGTYEFDVYLSDVSYDKLLNAGYVSSPWESMFNVNKDDLIVDNKTHVS